MSPIQPQKAITVGGDVAPSTTVVHGQVFYLGCGHEEPCPVFARPCSVDLYGAMQICWIATSGLLACATQGSESPLGRKRPGEMHLFRPEEVSTADAVARARTAQMAA